MKIQVLQQEVTNKIIEALEAGTIPWHCLWNLPSSEKSMPYNILTGKQYTGINVLILWLQSMKKRFTTNGWITYKQTEKMEGHVIKGERGCRCLYYNLKEIEDENSEEPKLVPYAKNFTVFNLDQVYGGKFTLPDASKFNIAEKAEQLITATNALIKEGRQAYYNKLEDFILTLPKSTFSQSEDYYATLFHELVHWTGHETRLNRELIAKKFGDENYAFEELVAELGSAFICAELGIKVNYDIFKAANLAAKAHKYIMPAEEEIGNL